MDLTDEMFYLATAKRFHDGDMLFRDDWNTGQLFGLLMMPFYDIYVFCHGSNEGIVLCSRILFVVLELFSAGFLIKILVHYTKTFQAVLIAAACIFVYARGNIITISYYSLGFHTFLQTILWWAEAEKRKDGKICCILAGFSFAVSVVCMPYMVILFVILSGTGIYWYTKGEFEKSRRTFWWLTGILLAAGMFMLYFWQRIPWKDLIEYIPMVFQDPGIENAGVLEQFFDLVFYILTVFLKYTWPVYIVTFFLVIFIGNGHIRNSTILNILPILLTVEFLVQSIYVRTYFESGTILVFFLLVLQIQLAYPEHRLKWLERHFLIPGFLFGIPWVLGSNVGERVINMSILLMNLWAVPCLWSVSQKYGRKCRVFIRMSALWMFAVLFIIRMFDVYRDGSVSRLTFQISRGSMKGIYTEENRKDSYEKMASLLKEETDNNDKIVVLGTNPWVYMETEALCGAYTVWKFDTEDLTHQQYYTRFPEKIPNTILIVPEEISIYESWKYSSHGVGMHREDQPILEGILKEILENEKYVCLEKDGAILYKSCL